MTPTATATPTEAKTPRTTPTPTEEATPLGPLSGTWEGTWVNSPPTPAIGTFTLVWAQQGTKLFGALTVTGSDYLRAGNVTGQIVGKNLSFGAVNTMELRIAVSTPSKSLVQVYLNNIKVYESTIADNGLKPVASVNMHNEHPDQVGDLIADDVRVATFGVTAPVNPCRLW